MRYLGWGLCATCKGLPRKDYPALDYLKNGFEHVREKIIRKVRE